MRSRYRPGPPQLTDLPALSAGGGLVERWTRLFLARVPVKNCLPHCLPQAELQDYITMRIALKCYTNVERHTHYHLKRCTTIRLSGPGVRFKPAGWPFGRNFRLMRVSEVQQERVIHWHLTLSRGNKQITGSTGQLPGGYVCDLLKISMLCEQACEKKKEWKFGLRKQAEANCASTICAAAAVEESLVMCS